MEQGINKIDFDKNPLKNRVSYGKFYYLRPTPMDILFEEQFINTDRSSFKLESIYEWNIDGVSEYGI